MLKRSKRLLNSGIEFSVFGNGFNLVFGDVSGKRIGVVGESLFSQPLKKVGECFPDHPQYGGVTHIRNTMTGISRLHGRNER